LRKNANKIAITKVDSCKYIILYLKKVNSLWIKHKYEINMRIFINICFILIPLIIGIVVYLLFRKPTYQLIFWISADGKSELLNRVNLSDTAIPDWIKYNLPDGLWIFSLTFSVLWLVDFDTRMRKSFVMVMSVLFFGLLFEFLQSSDIISGTFDWWDIIAYFIGFLSPILITRNYKIKNND